MVCPGESYSATSVKGLVCSLNVGTYLNIK